MKKQMPRSDIIYQVWEMCAKDSLYFDRTESRRYDGISIALHDAL